MKQTASVVVALALAAAASPAVNNAAHPLLSEGLTDLIARAAPANQPYGYTPQTVTCPASTPTIRNAASLSPQEQEWLPKRRDATLQPMQDLLQRMSISGFDAASYINQHKNNASALPNIGIAVSGGGYRAMLNGAGILEAFDSRTTNSTGTGQLGGLLQASTYLAGLSGGSWLVGSLFANNWTSIDQILAQDTPDSKSSSDLWQLDQSIFEGPESSGIQLLNTAGYYATLVDDVKGKENAGFNVTITDYWGRALSYQLINATGGGVSYTFSSVASQDYFTSGSVPLPLIVSDERSPHQKIVSLNSSIFTFNPWELGSEDPTVYAFAPLQYVGTNFSAGVPEDNSKCIVGFDNMGFVMGTSSSLFNAILTTVNSTNTTGLFSSALKAAISAVLAPLDQDEEDIADYPNPFYSYNNGTNINANTRRLTLVDGGEDGQNIPLHPLIQPYRHVDVIFAVDSSADTNSSYPTDASAPGWPDGTSLVATYQRSLSKQANGTAFPSIPDRPTFLNLGLASRPTFFGCDAANLTGPAPLIVYMPNNPYVYNSNTSTYDMEYKDTERNAIIQNAYNMATQGNGTLDAQWPACVGCAILSRSFDRTNTTVPDVCSQCFQRYCWNGTVDSRAPGNYVPAMKLPQFEIKNAAAGRSASVVLAAVTAAAVGFALL